MKDQKVNYFGEIWTLCNLDWNSVERLQKISPDFKVSITRDNGKEIIWVEVKHLNIY